MVRLTAMDVPNAWPSMLPRLARARDLRPGRRPGPGGRPVRPGPHRWARPGQRQRGGGGGAGPGRSEEARRRWRAEVRGGRREKRGGGCLGGASVPPGPPPYFPPYLPPRARRPAMCTAPSAPGGASRFRAAPSPDGAWAPPGPECPGLPSRDPGRVPRGGCGPDCLDVPGYPTSAGSAAGVPDQGPEHPWTARAGRVARDICEQSGPEGPPGYPTMVPSTPGPPVLAG